MKKEEESLDLVKYKNKHELRLSFKLKVLDDLIANQELESYIARKHSMSSGTLCSFRQRTLEKLGYYRILEQMKKDKQSGDLSKEEEVAKLKEALELATMKVAALETLIDVAEDQLNVAIRKKLGSKQSK